MIRVSLIFVSVLLMTCSDATIFETESVTMQSVKNGISVENKTLDIVYFQAIERETSALVDWAACADPQECEGVLPGNRRMILFDDILGYKAGKAVIVYWWNLEKQNDETHRVVNFQSAVVKP